MRVVCLLISSACATKSAELLLQAAVQLLGSGDVEHGDGLVVHVAEVLHLAAIDEDHVAILCEVGAELVILDLQHLNGWPDGPSR